MNDAFSNMPQSALFNQANTINYAINQRMLAVNTIQPCKITAVNSDGTYDLILLVNYLDAKNKPLPTPELYNIPPMKIGSYNYGIIIPYKEGDTVLVGFCQRDITNVKKNWTKQNPASLRRFNLQDGIILGLLTNTPQKIFIQIDDTGITMTAPNLPININCQDANITSSTTTVTSDTTTVIGDVVLGGDGGAAVLVETTVINDSTGKPCTVVSGAATKVTAL